MLKSLRDLRFVCDRLRANLRRNEHLAPCQYRELPLHPGKRAFNPSLVRFEGRLLSAYGFAEGWGPARLVLAEWDDDFNLHRERPIDGLLHDGLEHVEDMRLFVHQGILHGSYYEGFISRPHSGLVLVTFDRDFKIASRFAPVWGDRPRTNEKNWQFFSTGDELYCVYTISPHVVLKKQGETMQLVAQTPHHPRWRWGRLGGGTPPIEFNGEYLTFFHSHTGWAGRSGGWPARVYFAGAYTFQLKPPFAPLRMTRTPLMAAPKHDTDRRWPAVVFPCGAIQHGKKIAVSYGYHDQRPKLALYDPAELDKRLKPILISGK